MEQYNQRYGIRKKTAQVSRAIIIILQSIIFSFVWCCYYNFFAFRTNRGLGSIASVLLFLIIYCKMADLYRAFKVGTYPLPETVFSQFLAFGIADVILYVECCLIARRYVNIFPGLLTVVVQLLCSILWAILVKHFYMNHVPAMSTLVIYGENDVSHFLNKLSKKYSHIFNIKKILSSEEEIPFLLEAVNHCDLVLLYEVNYGRRTDLMTYCINEKKTFFVTPRISDIVMNGFENRHMIDTPLMKYDYAHSYFSYNFVKRLIDIIVSLFGLIITMPITLIAGLAIKLEDGGDVFFKQTRYTKDWKKFDIIKFRSMIMEAEKDGKPIPCKNGDDRITHIGKVLRKYRIDEIPQLINVLAGDMSLVGPRPERVEHVEAYTKELPEFAYRLRVKGGLTGYAQIYGKYNTSAYDKLRLDLMYIEKQSILLDLRMLMLTVKIIFTPESTEGFEEIVTPEVILETVAIKEGNK